MYHSKHLHIFVTNKRIKIYSHRSPFWLYQLTALGQFADIRYRPPETGTNKRRVYCSLRETANVSVI